MDLPDQSPLTSGQLELLQESANGTSDTRRLADKLSLSPGTINQYFKQIYAILRVTNRADAITEALRNGWIEIQRERARATSSQKKQKNRSLQGVAVSIPWAYDLLTVRN